MARRVPLADEVNRLSCDRGSEPPALARRRRSGELVEELPASLWVGVHLGAPLGYWPQPAGG